MPGPTVLQYMTASPHTIGSEQCVANAAEMMQQHGIRHLPVLHGGELLGVISDRDVKIVEAFKDVDPAEVAIAEAVGQEAYAVDPGTPLLQVVTTMLEHRYGSAVVMEGRKVAGIFTTVDALRALRDALQS